MNNENKNLASEKRSTQFIEWIAARMAHTHTLEHCYSTASHTATVVAISIYTLRVWLLATQYSAELKAYCKRAQNTQHSNCLSHSVALSYAHKSYYAFEVNCIQTCSICIWAMLCCIYIWIYLNEPKKPEPDLWLLERNRQKHAAASFLRQLWR